MVGAAMQNVHSALGCGWAIRRQDGTLASELVHYTLTQFID
jgi:hypothetical protein